MQFFTDRKVKDPIIIAGPCSAESQEQVFSTAKFLSQLDNVVAFRAGIWKPRSLPGMFEGVGETGLKWLAEVKRVFNIPIAIEVANAKHVEIALKYDVDIVWIGARTTVNPFYINELAEVLKGCRKAVMVKNPINPDLKLWIGAIERFLNNGITDIAAIHRGFCTFDDMLYRNTPLWDLPIELKRLKPDIPILVDPSHISGDKNMVLSIAQTAINYQMDGLIVEVHPDPDNAMSDNKQQLNFNEFTEMIDNLSFKKQTVGSDNDINLLRSMIDEIDYKIIKLLNERFNVSKKIGVIKKRESLPVLQMERWRCLLDERLKTADNYGLSVDFIKALFDIIHIESLKTQDNLMQNNDI